MKKIEEKLLFVSKEALIKKMEDEWSALEALEKNLQNRILNNNEKNEDILILLSNVEPIFTKPVEMWKDHDYAIRQLLFGVRFGHVLFYKKNQGYRTPNKLVLNSLFLPNETIDTPVSEHGGINSNPLRFSKASLEAIFEFFISQSKYIMTIHKLKEIH